jgi:threonine dehydrogenase-like Zn-dependent dehydrogenase
MKFANSTSVNFGRAPVRTVFPEALETLSKHQDLFEGFVTHKLPLTDAPRGFEIFEKYQARKVVFNP